MPSWDETVRGNFIADMGSLNPEWYDKAVSGGARGLEQLLETRPLPGSAAALAQEAIATGEFFFSAVPKLLEATMYKSPGELAQLSPELFTLASLGIVGSAPGAPKPISGTFDLGMVKGPKGATRSLRKLMIEEMRSRGKPLNPRFAFKYSPRMLEEVLEKTPIGSKSYEEILDALEFGKGSIAATKKLIDNVTRGPWFHGRRTYPKTGETFAKARIREGNLGEPYGLSLTADKGLLKRSFAKRQPKIDEVLAKLKQAYTKLDKQKEQLVDFRHAFNKKSMSLKAEDAEVVYERIEKKLLSIEGLKTRIQDKYDWLSINVPFARVLPRFGKSPSDVILPAWKGPGTEYAQEVLKEVYVEALRKQKIGQISRNERFTGGWGNRVDITKFNKDISQGLRDRGYKGLLYSTERGGFGEYELRMLNPEDVVMMDMRKPKEKALERITKGIKLPDQPQFDPSLPNFPGGWKRGRQTERLNRWQRFVEGRPSSLRDIYKDIDLEKLTLD